VGMFAGHNGAPTAIGDAILGRSKSSTTSPGQSQDVKEKFSLHGFL
jgi:hypothetical protein